MDAFIDVIDDLIDDLKDLIVPIIALLVIGGIFAITGTILISSLEESECKAKATKQNLEYDYNLSQGCMVKTENGWIDYKRLIYKKDIE